MVQILPPVETFGEKIAKGLGLGISEGVTNATEHFIKKHQQQQLKNYFSELAAKHPGDRSYELLASVYGSPVPANEREGIVKSLLGSDPHRNEQQERLKMDSISSRYNQAINQIDSGIKNGLYRFGTPEYKEAIDMRHRLSKERDKILGFQKMQEEMSGETQDEIIGKDFDEVETPAKEKKIRFDAKNPKHRAVRDKVLKQAGGNREKAGKILSRKFDL